MCISPRVRERGSPLLLLRVTTTPLEKREKQTPKNGVDTLNYFSPLSSLFLESLFKLHASREEQKNTITLLIKGGRERESFERVSFVRVNLVV